MIFNVNSGAGKQPVNIVPSTNSAFTYDGSAKTPLWQNFDPEQLTISGADSATNAGTHTVYFTPKADYEWWDGTSTPKEVTWSIAKAVGSFSLSATSGTIEGKNKTKTFTVTRVGDGDISVSSSNTGIATVSVSGTTVTVTSKGYGSTTITVSVAEGTNHEASGSVTYAVTVDYVHLYKNGDQKAALTGGWYTSANTIGTVSYNTSSITVKVTNNNDGFVKCSTRNAIDLSPYKTIKIRVTDFSKASTSTPSFSVTSISTATTNTVANVNISGTGTWTLDVSKVTGSYYIGIWAYWSNNWSITFDEVYLVD